MNNKPQYNRKGSAKNKILRAIMSNGVLPYRALRMLGKKETMEKAVHDMKRDGIVEILKYKHSPEIKSVVLKNYEVKKKEYINGLPSELVDEYEQSIKKVDAQKIGDPVARDRVCSKAEARMFFSWSDIPSYKGERPEIDTAISEYAYYTAREIKSATQREDDPNNKLGEAKVKGSRISGWYSSPAGWYTVYNILNKSISISRTTEYRMLYGINAVLSFHGIAAKQSESIVLYRNWSRVGLAIKGDSMRSEPFRIETLQSFYEKVHMIPKTDTGRKLVQVLGNENWRERMQLQLIPEKDRAKQFSTIPCDGISSKGVYTLIGIIPNYNDVSGFVNAAIAMDTPEKYIIKCLADQVEMYTDITEGKCQLEVVDLDQLIKQTDFFISE